MAVSTDVTFNPKGCNVIVHSDDPNSPAVCAIRRYVEGNGGVFHDVRPIGGDPGLALSKTITNDYLKDGSSANSYCYAFIGAADRKIIEALKPSAEQLARLQGKQSRRLYGLSILGDVTGLTNDERAAYEQEASEFDENFLKANELEDIIECQSVDANTAYDEAWAKQFVEGSMDPAADRRNDRG
ncbi:hypothetical protein HIM_11757 [Hirsutella minnesotensis 3608]|uniref:Uncharacterized protein n=1 Tax=Hirsutella minnesotensis 3608 TaxID=1043627 RepID=A0A0F8A0U2_9HYPO|nr:hypothetical protein HIM_11757 [Hirsutella minnesotensis 3608]